MTYGCEAWNIDERTRATLNGANARCLSRFTGQTSHEEASKTKRTFDMVTAIKKRRHQWLGHILRLGKTHAGKERLIKVAVRAQFQLNLPGNLCADAPHTDTFEELERIAQDRKAWRQHWQSIAPKSSKIATSSKHAQSNASQGRWIGTGIDAVWVNANGTVSNARPPANTTDTCNNTATAGRWIGSGIDAVWVNANRVISDAPPPAGTCNNATTTTSPTMTTNAPTIKRKQKKKKRKRTASGWTNEQRQAWARAYYDEHFGNKAKKENNTLDTKSTDELWAEPCIPPTPSPPSTPIAATTRATPPLSTTPQTTVECTSSPPYTPQYRRAQQLRQLRLLRQQRFKKQGRPAPPPHTPIQQHTGASQPKTNQTNHATPTPTPISFNTSISPITIHTTHTQTQLHVNLSPITPNPNSIHILTTNTHNDSMNDFLNETHPYNTTHPNNSHPHPSIHDHTNIMIDIHSPKHTKHTINTYIHTHTTESEY